MLKLIIQFEYTKSVVGDIKIARFDVQDVIVADMEIFDDQELGMILVDPAGKKSLELLTCTGYTAYTATSYLVGDRKTYIASVAYKEVEYSNVDVETVRSTSATVREKLNISWLFHSHAVDIVF
jgi:hypothetical protein